MKSLLKTYDYVIGTGGQSWYSFFTTYIRVDIAYHEIFRSEVSKGGINTSTLHFVPDLSLA